MFFRVRRVGCLGAVASSKTALAMRPQVVAYGFATPAATLCLSTNGPCRLPCERRSGHPKTSNARPLVNLHPPSEFQAHSPGQLTAAPFKRWDGICWLLSRGSSPLQRSRYKASTQRGVACRFVPTAPFLTTSPVCSALNRPAISAGGTPGVCFAWRVTPVPPSNRRVAALVVPS